MSTNYQNILKATSVNAAQAAARWVEVQKNKEALPLLQYDAVLDGHTSKLCKGLEGITRPVDDDFWNEYYPPNHWGCRSTVRQLQKGMGKITDISKLVYPNKLPPMFKVNLAKQGLAYPPEHPYYDEFDIKKEHEILAQLPEKALFIPVSENVKLYTFTNQNKEDFELRLKVATEISKGDSIKILPDLMPSTNPLRSKIFPNKKGGVCPDFYSSKYGYIEVEDSTNSENENNIRRAANRGSNQANYVITNLSKEVDERLLYKIAKGQFSKKPFLKIIRFRYNGNYKTFLKNDSN